MIIDVNRLQNWKARRRTGDIAPDTLAFDYGYLRPPVDVFSIASQLGVEIRAIKKNANFSADGCLLIHEGRPFILVRPDHPRVRQRFTVAHELGHLLLHDLKEVRADLSLDETDVYWRNMRSGPFTKNIKEAEANRFAAELLMPTYLMQAEAPGSTLYTLARDFDVSQTAMNLRLRELYGLSRG